VSIINVFLSTNCIRSLSDEIIVYPNPTKGNFEIALKEGQLDLKKMFPTIRFLKNKKPIKLTLNANGSMQNINLDFLKFTNNDIDFTGSAKIQDASNLSKIKWNLAIDSLKAKTNYFFNNKNLDPNFKKLLSEIKKIKLSGNISSSSEKLLNILHDLKPAHMAKYHPQY
jgi:hypothetical protein